MAKFHINSKGIPAPCHAKKGNCPFGGEDSHYDNMEKAKEEAHKRNEAEHSILPVNSPSTRYTNQDLKYSINPILKMISNDVSVELNSGEKVDGILTRESDIGEISIMPYGALSSNNTINLNPNDIKHIDQLSNRENGWSSNRGNEWSINRQYQKELRVSNKARPEFRFSKEQMQDMTSKFAKVNYDGQRFNGQIMNFKEDNDNSILVIKNPEGEIAEIENYKLTQLEITGNDERAHENHLINDEVIDKIVEDYKEDEEYITINPEDSFDEDFEEQYRPQAKIDEYFEARIRAHSGEQVDLESYENINWYKEIEDNSDYYKETEMSWNDTHGANLNESWTSNSEERYDEAYDMADNAYVYFGERQDLIDDAFKEVQKVDWTPYHNSQLEGEIAALKRIHTEGVISL